MLLELKRLVGREHRLDEVAHEIKNAVQGLSPAAVGAHHINCSDESERECSEAFHSIVDRNLLPAMRYWSRAAFRTINLGGRYEAGSLAIAEEHFATAKAERGFKLIIVKNNSHVSIAQDAERTVFGHMDRYDRDSRFCGALHLLLSGATGGALDELGALFRAGKLDRVAILNDERYVEPRLRALYAAIVNARLQAGRIATEAKGHEAHGATLYVILPAVTLNRQDADTELLAGVLTVDTRGKRIARKYFGLGADPRKYRFKQAAGAIAIEEA